MESEIKKLKPEMEKKCSENWLNSGSVLKRKQNFLRNKMFTMPLERVYSNESLKKDIKWKQESNQQKEVGIKKR